MPNPFFVAPNSAQNNDIKNAYNMFVRSKNPTEVFMKMANNNPSLKPIINMMQSGSNPKDLFLMLCNQKGVDPNSILNMLK